MHRGAGVSDRPAPFGLRAEAHREDGSTPLTAKPESE